MRKLTLLLLCLALGIGVCDAKKKNRGVYFRTDAEIVLDKPYFGLNVSNMIQVVLEADRNPASVRVETENVPAEAVSVRVRRGELVLACDPGALSSKRKNDMSKRVVVYVGAAPLESFSAVIFFTMVKPMASFTISFTFLAFLPRLLRGSIQILVASSWAANVTF